MRAAPRQPPNQTWGGHVQAYVTVVYQRHALQNVRHLYPCLLQPMGALFNKRFVIVLLPFSYVFITVFIYLFYFNFNFFLICFWRTSDSFFVIFSCIVPDRGQPAAKCHPRWQPTKRLAVSCGLGRRQCPLQVKNKPVARFSTTHLPLNSAWPRTGTLHMDEIHREFVLNLRCTLLQFNNISLFFSYESLFKKSCRCTEAQTNLQPPRFY